MPSPGLSAAEGMLGERERSREILVGSKGRERGRGGKAGGRGRSPSEVNDLFANFTLNLPTLLKAEWGHLEEQSRSERPPRA